MSTIRNPVGPQPSKVYWRRRLAVLVGLVVIIVIIILIVARPGSGKPVAINTHTPSPTTAATAPACKKSNVQIIAVTDANSYAAGVESDAVVDHHEHRSRGLLVQRWQRRSEVFDHERHRHHLVVDGLPDQRRCAHLDPSAGEVGVEHAVRLEPHTLECLGLHRDERSAGHGGRCELPPDGVGGWRQLERGELPAVRSALMGFVR